MVRKREDGRWEGRIVVGHKENGEPIFRYVLAKTQKELLAKLHRDMDIYQDAQLTEDSRMTLGEWLDRWMEEYGAVTGGLCRFILDCIDIDGGKAFLSRRFQFRERFFRYFGRHSEVLLFSI